MENKVYTEYDNECMIYLSLQEEIKERLENAFDGAF